MYACLRTRSHQVHAGFVLLTCLAFTAYMIAGEHGKAVIFLGMILLPIAAILLGRRVNDLRDALPWRVLIVGLLFLAVPSALRAINPSVVESAFYPTLRHVCMALGYVGLLSGSVILLVRHSPHDPGGAIDAALVGLSGAGVLWEALLRPQLLSLGVQTGGQFSVLVKVLILMALLGALFRLAITTVRARGTLNYLIISSIGTLMGVTLSAVLVGTDGTDYPAWVRGCWFIGYMGVAAAALHPSAAHLSSPDRTVPDELTPRRLVRMGIILVISPVVAGVSQIAWARPDVLVLAVGTTLAVPLVLLRFWQLAVQRAYAEQALAHQATHDDLTGLPNRRAVLTHMQRALAQRPSGGAPQAAVLFCDLDGFKPINDNLGHQAGDLVLQAVAQRLRGCIRGTDMVARVGGDEFLVFSPVASTSNAADMVRRIQQSMQEPIMCAGQPCVVGLSVGVAVASPGAPTTAEELIKAADTAMYEQKRNRPGRDFDQIRHSFARPAPLTPTNDHSTTADGSWVPTTATP